MTDYYDIGLLEKDQDDTSEEPRMDQQIREDFASLYSIVVALENLEKVFTKDAISPDTFESTSNVLLQQWDSCLKDETVSSLFVSLEDFLSKYQLQCPRAMKRIQEHSEIAPTNKTPSNTPNHLSNTREQVAASTESPSDREPTIASAPLTTPAVSTAKSIAELVQNFITTLDAIRLNFVAKDQLHPLLSELVICMDDLTEMLNKQVSGRSKLVQWLIFINHMEPTDQLNEEQKDELLHNLEETYSECYGLL
ncbi:ESCRT I complex subunit Vps28 [Schizosaccharomyces cryophilus OY26]|uniref:Vacuolar protein sorting-associated protein 28 n=1 Tax=Schizosaccharomyces cryophilus (strain OY26 / ATCC MYA-4695 / CBS 11777 / NBRC 106824 / NRRL Y48691) TaxID=653667 RepID=S9W3P3_SCHCR|nr:ESCRT I complex subunit Vps28 [Schizosaccharomyces cryophilus OY26]EPY52565.1 ESCRT I complex subunit Vps28 [Schizosaccharomyces cryophilus OY26]